MMRVEKCAGGTMDGSLDLGGGARAGRVSLALALLAALIVCGGATYYFLRTDGPRDGGEPSVTESSDPADGGGSSGALSGAATRAAPPADQTPAATADRDAGTDTPAERRIHGSVTDRENAALAGASLRWMPLGVLDLRRYSHDSRALGMDGDPSRLPVGRVRDALTRSVLTSSADDGAYEMRVPLEGDTGVVVVTKAGYEMKIVAANPEDIPGAVVVVDESGSEPGAGADIEPSEPDFSSDVEIHFELGPAGAISGRVTDSESGDVVPGMAVVAGAIDPDASAMMSFVDRDAPGCVVRPDGTYLLAGLEPGEYRVLPRTGDSDYVAFSTRQAAKVDLEPGMEVTDVDFEVTRGARVFGTITGPRDKAIEGAECKVLPTNLVEASMTGDVEAITMFGDRSDHTDASGYYEIRGIPRGMKHRVAAEADDYAPATSEVIEPVGESLEVNLALTVGSSISGRVFDSNGEPAPGATVTVVPDLQKIMAGNFEAASDLKTEADASGAFRLEHLASGEYRLHPGELKAQDMWGNQKNGQVVEVDGIHDVTDVELVIPGVERGTLAGIVTDDEGTPLEEATIQVSKPDDFMGMASTKLKTGADGRFSASDLEGGTFRIGASKLGYASVRLDGIASGNTGVEIVLPRHGRVSGRVTTLEGVALVEGGRVWAQKVGSQSFFENLQSMVPGAGGGNREVALRPDGTFSVDAPAGAVEIHATVPTFAPAVSGAVTVSPGEELSGVEILVTSGAVVLGRVTFAREGVQGASVIVTPVKEGDATSDMMSELMPQMFGKNRNQALTDRDGYFEVRHLAPGQYKVQAAHGDYAPSDPLRVTLRRDQVREIRDLALSVGGAIRGVVLDGEAPKVGLMVQLMGVGPMKQAATAADGTFEFRGLKAGEYMVNLMDVSSMAQGAMTFKTRPVTVEDEQTTDLRVMFGVGVRVHGKITGLPPAPMRMVTLRRPGGPAPEDLDPTNIQDSVEASRYQAGMAMIGPDGRYEILDVEPGEYILEVLRMPSDPTDMEAFRNMDRTPHQRAELEIKKEDVELNLVVK